MDPGWWTYPHANLPSADLIYANLSRADLFGANLSRADLIYANLSRADLINAYLNNADLSRADLSDAKNLTQAQLDLACGRPKALPEGLKLDYRPCELNPVTTP